MACKFNLCFLLCLTLRLDAQLAPPAPIIDTELKAGLTEFSGRFSIPPSGVNVTLQINRSNSTTTYPVTDILINQVRGSFIARLEPDQKLLPGETLSAILFFGRHSSPEVTLTVKSGPPKAIALEIPKEGQSEIRGTADNVSKLRVVVFGEGIATLPTMRDRLAWVRLELANAETSLKTARIAQKSNVQEASGVLKTALREQEDAENHYKEELIKLAGDDRRAADLVIFEDDVAVASGAYKVTLAQPLDAGLTVLVYDPTDSTTARYRAVQSVAINYGRFRGSFLLGGTVGPSSSKSPTDVYLGFYGEGFLGGKLLNKDPDDSRNFFPRFRAELRAFGEVRLTQTGTSSSTTSTASTPTISSVRSSFTQFGLYAPLHWNGLDWTFRGTPHSWFIAPVIKIGGVVPDGGILLSRTTATAATGESKVAEERITGFQPFLHGGLRLGLSRYQLITAEITQRNRQVSPELLTYFDITYGPFSQFPRYTTEPLAGRDFSTFINGRRTNRFQIETRLKLPNAPIQIGVDYNIADTVSSREPNDWRLIIAYRGDANKLLSRIFGFVK